MGRQKPDYAKPLKVTFPKTCIIILLAININNAGPKFIFLDTKRGLFSETTILSPGGILPYKGLMGTCSQSGYGFRGFLSLTDVITFS